jgi:hypothetical protein
VTDLSNVRLLIKKGENDFHWYIRKLFVEEALTKGIGISKYLSGYKSQVYTAPKPVAVGDKFFVDVYELYKAEIDNIISYLPKDRTGKMDGKDKSILAVRKVLHTMCKELNISW